MITDTSMPYKRSRSRATSAQTLRRRPRIALFALCVPLLLFLLVPLLALALRIAPGAVLKYVGEPTVIQALQLSMITSVITALVVMLLGTPVAYLLARYEFRGRAILDTLIDLPMVLPPSVAGIALLITFGRRGIVGQYLDAAGISIAFTPTAVILAQTFVAAPFYIKAATSGFRGVASELEEAAAIDGASGLHVFRAVTLPLSRTALLSGLVMTWARALGEFGATIIFAGNFPGRTQTMPLAIYLGFELDFSIALTLAALLLAVSFSVLFVVKRVLGQTLVT